MNCPADDSSGQPISMTLESQKIQIEIFKAYFDVSKQIDWVLFGFIPAIFLFGGIVATFIVDILKVSNEMVSEVSKTAPPTYNPPNVVLGFTFTIVFLTCLLAIIGIIGLKKDQIRLWKFLASFEKRLGIEAQNSFFETKIQDFPDPGKPFKRKSYFAIIVILALFEILFGYVAIVCFWFPSLVSKWLTG